ncbi:MAG: cupredoxin family protein [Casimicrobiaceae bacterium]
MVSGWAAGHGDEGHDKAAAPVKKEQTAWGVAGDPKAVKKTIEIRMLDSMRFTPDVVNVRQGDTVRLKLANHGKIMHELVLGTKQALDEHAALMVKFPGMEHAEAHMAHVASGKTGEIVWTFNRPGEFDFACLIPGHYQAGMVGTIKVAAR